MKKEDRITISEASRILSVSEQALRQWTDQGRIKAFITPGGHRRYSLADLQRFLNRNKKTLGLKELASDLERISPVLHDTAMNYLPLTSWQGQLNPESQIRLASLGRQLLSLIERSVAKASWQEEDSEEVQELGANFGRVLAGQGLPLVDALKTFLQHRTPIIEVITEILRKKERFNQRIVRAVPIVNNALDEALISLVMVYTQQRRDYQRNPD